MFNFLKGVQNDHIEGVRLLGFISALAGIGYTGAHLFINHSFSIIEFGTGMGVLIAGVAGGAGYKDTQVANARKTIKDTDCNNSNNGPHGPGPGDNGFGNDH